MGFHRGESPTEFQTMPSTRKRIEIRHCQIQPVKVRPRVFTPEVESLCQRAPPIKCPHVLPARSSRLLQNTDHPIHNFTTSKLVSVITCNLELDISHRDSLVIHSSILKFPTISTTVITAKYAMAYRMVPKYRSIPDPQPLLTAATEYQIRRASSSCRTLMI